jgi:hypothetical protein
MNYILSAESNLAAGGCSVVYYVAIAFIFGICAAFVLTRLARYTDISMYEVATDMVPIEREVLEETIAYSESQPETPDARFRRKRLRLDLDTIQIRLHRILTNAKRPKYWALNDQRMNRKNKLEHPPEVADGIKRVLEAERELWRKTVWLLVKIWVWNITAFQRREWGPIPDVRRFRIQEILEAYDNVRAAAVDLARSYGEAAVAEEIAAAM